VLDVIGLLFGLVNLISTGRVSLTLAVSGTLAMLLFFKLSDRLDAWASAVITIIIALAVGIFWQTRFQRQTSEPSGPQQTHGMNGALPMCRDSSGRRLNRVQ
jgi:hypothetical protein